jgi:hypothetical protein
MFDNKIFGFGDFQACKTVECFAKSLGYKQSKDWVLPSCELLKEIYPFDASLNFPQEGLVWTDSAYDNSLDIKKFNLVNGQFIDCNSPEDYNQPAHFRLYCKNEFQDIEVDHYDSGCFAFIILPFGKMTFNEVDGLNSALSNVSFMGFQHFKRPDADQLAMVFPIISHLFTGEDSWFWCSTAENSPEANWFNMTNGEIYVCNNVDYSLNKAFNLAIVEWG